MGCRLGMVGAKAPGSLGMPRLQPIRYHFRQVRCLEIIAPSIPQSFMPALALADIRALIGGAVAERPYRASFDLSVNSSML